MKRVYLPTESAEDWKTLLADPEKQWKTGYSAKSLAEDWESTIGFPKSVKNVFDNSRDVNIVSLEQLFSFPEYKVALPGGSKASQNDLYVLSKNQSGLMCIMIEGKVEESFDKLVVKWSNGVSNGIDNARLKYLIDLLGLTNQKKEVLKVRYQLLHRTASAIIEAQRTDSKQAMMMVHSFSKKNSWFDDYKSFLKLFNLSAKLNEVSKPVKIAGIELYFCWIKG